MIPRDKWWYKFDLVAMIDPAFKQEERNCESAIATVGGLHLTERSEIYMLDARSGHWKDLELLAQMYLVHGLYEPNHVGIEDATGQGMFKTLTELSRDKPHSFDLQLHNSQMHGRKKVNRFQKAVHHIDHVRFKRGDAIQDRLIDQLVTYQGNRNDKFDLGDAFCMAINEYMRLFPPGNRESIPYQTPIYDSVGNIVRYA